MEEKDIYKKLYFHAFNRYTELVEQAQSAQKKLEEMYISLTEETMDT